MGKGRLRNAVAKRVSASLPGCSIIMPATRTYSEEMVDFRAAIEHVCEVFKISSLFPEQEECLKAVFDGKIVYASLPTAYGKSLIYYANIPIVADFDRQRVYFHLARPLDLNLHNSFIFI